MEAYAGPIRRLCAAYAAGAADREDLFQAVTASHLIGAQMHMNRATLVVLFLLGVSILAQDPDSDLLRSNSLSIGSS